MSDRNRPLTGSLLRRVSVSFASQILSLSITLIDRIVLVAILFRVWGADLYSDWATLLAGAGLFALGEFGLGIYFGNAWQKASARSDDAAFQRLLGVSLFLYLMTGLTLAGVGICVMMFELDDLVTVRELSTQSSMTAFALLVSANILRVMRGSLSQVYRGRGNFALGTLINLLPSFAAVVLAGCSGLLGGGVVVVASMYVIAEVAAGWFFLLTDLRRRYPSLQLGVVRPSRDEAREIFGRVKWFALLQCVPTAWLQMPVLMLNAINITGVPLVSFIVTRTLVNFARQISSLLSISVGVEAVTTLHRGDEQSLASVLSSFGRFLCALTGAITGGLLIFGPPAIAFWTGDSDLGDRWLIFWFLAPSILVAPATPLATLMTLGNSPRPAAIANLVQLILGLSLGLALAIQFGAVGAAAGLGIGEAIGVGIILPAIAHRLAGVKYPRYLLTCVVASVLAAFWSGAVAMTASRLMDLGQPFHFVLAALIWCAIGALPPAWLGLPVGQRARLLESLSNRINPKARGSSPSSTTPKSKDSP